MFLWFIPGVQVANFFVKGQIKDSLYGVGLIIGNSEMQKILMQFFPFCDQFDV